jgi:hypothetical protein
MQWAVHEMGLGGWGGWGGLKGDWTPLMERKTIIMLISFT